MTTYPEWVIFRAGSDDTSIRYVHAPTGFEALRAVLGDSLDYSERPTASEASVGHTKDGTVYLVSPVKPGFVSPVVARVKGGW